MILLQVKGADVRPRNRTPQENINAIYCAVRDAEFPLTRLEIAQAIGRKKSPHLTKFIEQLVTTGFFVKLEQPEANGTTRFVYWTPDKMQEYARRWAVPQPVSRQGE